jgi:3-methyladenine DNA glycosylase AlkD
MMKAYTKELVEWFTVHRNDQNAAAMEKYMRNQFPFLGIKTPERRELVKNFLKENGVPAKEGIRIVLNSLWELPEREYQYAGLDILNKAKKSFEKEHITLVEWLITHKSWWDTVDALASKSAGYLLQTYPDLIPVYAERWIESDNMWLQRSALLFQLKYKTATNTDLLFDYIQRCAHSNEFFIQKAIGWVLREYSKTDPEAVKTFIDHHELKPLSKKEGLKYINSMIKQ